MAPTTSATFSACCLQMAVVLTYAGALPVVKVGRIAGQFAKPRSSTDREDQDGVELPSYRGDIINDIAFTPEARIPDPQRQMMAYRQSAATLNLLRAFATGGFANLGSVHQWMLGFLKDLPAVAPLQGTGRSYLGRAELHARLRPRSGEAIPNCARPISTPATRRCCSATSRRFTRVDSTTGDWYATSGHMIWIGDRTRQLDHGACRVFPRHQESDRPEMRPVARSRTS